MVNGKHDEVGTLIQNIEEKLPDLSVKETDRSGSRNKIREMK